MRHLNSWQTYNADGELGSSLSREHESCLSTALFYEGQSELQTQRREPSPASTLVTSLTDTAAYQTQ
jgi:hypothetical protein